MKFMKKVILLVLILSKMSNAQRVNWTSFTPDIFQKAQQQQKPVLLHLAANWCHWCHVMEEKTYGDPNVIKYLNENFIACTEDHDKRPDLANKYRDYGWPATILFSPDGKELFKQAGFIEATEFLEILKKIKNEPNVVNITNHQIKSTTPNTKNLYYIKKDVFNSIDLNRGGFASPQKSVDFEMFEYAFNHLNNDTLKKWLKITMKNSIYLTDKEWGGVYQYSTYGDWVHPHYEKLLSVQARYIKMYLWYFYFTKDSTYFKLALKNVNYVYRFLKKKDGTFANAQDADLIKGKKAHNFFKLKNEERLKLGIPSIDTNAFTDNNSKIAESLIYLFWYTKDSTYLKDAITTIEYLITKRFRKDSLFNHSYTNDFTPAIVDQIYPCKTLFLLYRATNNARYLKMAQKTMNAITYKFHKNNYVLSYLPLPGYLPPDAIVSENIETARLFNLYGKVFNKKEWIQIAKSIFDYLISDEVYEKIIVEPGILTLSEEVEKEPLTGIYLVINLRNQDKALVQSMHQIPYFYYYAQAIRDFSVFPEKKELFESFNDNVLLFCTSTFCSAPIYQKEDLIQFLKKFFQKM